jgi:hypothetical protein
MDSFQHLSKNEIDGKSQLILAFGGANGQIK